MEQRRALALGITVVAGLGVGAAIILGLQPAPAPSAPGASSAPARVVAEPSAPSAPTRGGPTPSAPAAPVETVEAEPQGLPPLQVLPVSRPKDWPPVDPIEAAAWANEAPVALHAASAADTWEELAWRFEEEGDRARAWEAMSLSARLRRAEKPVPQDEVTSLLVAEIDMLRTLMLESEQLAEELEPTLQGAHHAIQGAPPPVPRD